MIRVRIILVFSVATLLLTACNSSSKNNSTSDSSEGYVDVSAVIEQSGNISDNQSEYIDTSRNHSEVKDCSFDGVYFNDFNTLAKTFEQNCAEPTCNHSGDTCKFMRYRGAIPRNGVYYTSDNNSGAVISYQNGESEVLFSPTNDKEKSTLLHFIDDSKVISCGYNDIKLINLDSQKLECYVGEISDVNRDKEEITDEDIYATMFMTMAVVDENTVAVTNMNFELFCVDLKTQTSKKLADYVSCVQTDGESLYYLNVKDGENKIIRCDTNGENATVLATNSLPSFQIMKDSVIYFKMNADERSKKTLYISYFSDIKEQELYYCSDEQVGYFVDMCVFDGFEDKLYISCWPNEAVVLVGENPQGVIIYDFENKNAEVYKNSDFAIEDE